MQTSVHFKHYHVKNVPLKIYNNEKIRRNSLLVDTSFKNKLLKHTLASVLFSSCITYTRNAHAFHIIETKIPRNSSSITTQSITTPYANFSAGSVGQLAPEQWGISYNGTNPTMALFMSSAGISLRMVINIAVIYYIYTYWVNDE